MVMRRKVMIQSVFDFRPFVYSHMTDLLLQIWRMIAMRTGAISPYQTALQINDLIGSTCSRFMTAPSSTETMITK